MIRIGLKVNQFVHVPTSVDTQHFIQIHAHVSSNFSHIQTDRQTDKRMRACKRKHIPPPLSELNKFSKFYKISSVLNKIMLKILWLCFCGRSLEPFCVVDKKCYLLYRHLTILNWCFWPMVSSAYPEHYLVRVCNEFRSPSAYWPATAITYCADQTPGVVWPRGPGRQVSRSFPCSTSLHIACPKELEAASRSSKTYLAKNGGGRSAPI